MNLETSVTARGHAVPGKAVHYRLADVRMGVMQTHRIRLRPAGPSDREWSCRTLDRVSRGYGTRIRVGQDGLLRLT
ncbi:hypothetical protein EV651_101638 [Kribbella sp. VKM Ac-2571]|uniref:hypothetical protein n=1 Tax=Kribbella sp. VKM Ac-2571 TaxID=2512222 RepID=UPI0010D6713F|nr:hypothetical protein EV651_101638 [Kribbella sp. VKM Ac-2571]